MPNRKKIASPAHVPGKATLSHATAIQLNTKLNFPLKGTKETVLRDLSLVMAVQVAYIINAIENDGAEKNNEELQMAVNIYLEAKCKYHYITNDIEH